MTPEQEKRLREMSIEELNNLTIQKMEASAQLHSLNNDPRHKDWATEGGYVIWNRWVQELGKEGAKDKMREIQKLSIGVPKYFSEEVRKKMSEAGKSVLGSEKGREIQRMGGSVAGKISQKIERTCPHCNKTIQGPLYFRYHGDKCKMKS